METTGCRPSPGAYAPLDTSTVHPILLLLMGLPSEKLAPESRDKIVVDLESYLVRRFVCRMTTKNYNRFFLNLLRSLKRASEQNEDLAPGCSQGIAQAYGADGRLAFGQRFP